MFLVLGITCILETELVYSADASLCSSILKTIQKSKKTPKLYKTDDGELLLPSVRGNCVVRIRKNGRYELKCVHTSYTTIWPCQILNM